jgi:hypothetical protein
MTVFTVACWKRSFSRAACLLGWLLCAGLAWAGVIEPKSINLVPDETGQALSADFAVELGPRLAEAVERGVQLHFRLEFTLARKRWYWIDEHVAGRVLEYKLSYQALTRQYRLSQGGQQQTFDSLDDALKALSRVARLHVVDRTELIPGETYRAAARLSLDRNQLPKPLQVDALADRDWRVEARTHTWEFVAADK